MFAYLVQLQVQSPAFVESCRVDLAGSSFRVPVARTDVQQLAGLRHDRGYAGMLFEPAPASLTMTGVRNSLQALGLKSTEAIYSVSEVLELQPGVEEYSLSDGLRAVLELSSHYAVSVGDSVVVSDCR